MTKSQIKRLIQRSFASYRSADRNEIESLLTDDFTFTSPYDDHIDRAAYFERCWPLAGTFEYHDLQQFFVNGNECVVLYEGKAKNGAMFRNTELFRVENGQIRSVEVFFGLPPQTVVAAPEDEIRLVVESLMQAIRDKNADAIMDGYAPDVLAFDVVAPLELRGSDAVRQRLETWLTAYEGPIGCEIRDLEVEASGDLAFCSGYQRISGTMISRTQVDMWVRMTMGFRRIDGRWRITHAHLSDPFDPESGQALTDLVPGRHV